MKHLTIPGKVVSKIKKDILYVNKQGELIYGKMRLTFKRKIDHDKKVSLLLRSYSKLGKKDFTEGRRIRRKLRRIGYKLSKHNGRRKR